MVLFACILVIIALFAMTATAAQAQITEEQGSEIIHENERWRIQLADE
jgi:hypothetical protein